MFFSSQPVSAKPITLTVVVHDPLIFISTNRTLVRDSGGRELPLYPHLATELGMIPGVSSVNFISIGNDDITLDIVDPLFFDHQRIAKTAMMVTHENLLHPSIRHYTGAEQMFQAPSTPLRVRSYGWGGSSEAGIEINKDLVPYYFGWKAWRDWRVPLRNNDPKLAEKLFTIEKDPCVDYVTVAKYRIEAKIKFDHSPKTHCNENMRDGAPERIRDDIESAVRKHVH